MKDQEVIGLLPAAGHGTRISPLPMSKELYPIGFRLVEPDHSLRSKVVGHYLLEKMHLAGISKAYVVLRSGKWDIPNYFQDGAMLNMDLGYLIMRLPFGVPYTLDQAYPFVKEALIAVGFPDIICQPDDIFIKLLARLRASNSEVVLGLFPTDYPQKVGVVDFDQEGRVYQILEKSNRTDLPYMWGVAVWTPVFTNFMHEYLAKRESQKLQSNGKNNPQLQRELPLGDVIQAAIDVGLPVEAEVFADGEYLDIGTPEDLVRAVRNFANYQLPRN
ncbi:MAG: dTDP-glucose pyrophosphorylase [Symploca sp. SIO2D2]|nr:dTDP-glucose pyrophosphorylase [Symploca sp. SIO2D2]NER19517.1 dTDP-glucose pyrophosphorylase [Symploca sp. SIO1C2]